MSKDELDKIKTELARKGQEAVGCRIVGNSVICNTALKEEVKIKPNEWIQVGGDVSYENYGLIIAKYNPSTKEISVVQIEPYEERGKTKYYAQEETFNIEDLRTHKLSEFGLDPEMYKDQGLELIAEELLTTYGGNPIQIGAGFDTTYKSEFSSFKKALGAAIGTEETFKSWSDEE